MLAMYIVGFHLIFLDASTQPKSEAYQKALMPQERPVSISNLVTAHKQQDGWSVGHAVLLSLKIEYSTRHKGVSMNLVHTRPL